jgi:endonuclease G
MKKLLLFLLLATVSASAQVVTLHLKYYTVTFDEGKKVPLCNYYTLTKANLKNGGAQRSPSFHQEPKIPAKFQATDKDYSSANHSLKGKDNTYDKGHLVPDDDMRMNAESEPSCMTYANVAPQISSFNEILWRGVETYVRTLGASCDSIQIWTGCIYGTQTIGSNIAVPTYYYKVIRCFGKVNTAEAFLCSNEAHTDKVVAHYIVPITEISKLTGYSFVR